MKLAPFGDREILVTRGFDAARERVFEASTQPEILKRWLLGPPGWEMPVCEVDLKVGGQYHYLWRNAQGGQFEVKGVFREIEHPERIVHTESFEPRWYPGEALVTSILTEQAGKTTLSLRLRFESRDARDAVLDSDMENGLAISYERLDELLRAEQLEPTLPAPTEAKNAIALPKVALGALATGFFATGARAIGALSVGAFALGSFAVGRAAFRYLAVRRLRIRSLEIDELRVGRVVDEKGKVVRFELRR